MLKDLRHAARLLLHAKGWTAVVVLSLALGIGANTAIFSAVNSLLIKEIPVNEPNTLVRLRWGGRNDMVTSSSDYGFSKLGADGRNVRATFSYAMYQQFLADNKTMSDLIACAPYGRVNVVVDGNADIASRSSRAVTTIASSASAPAWGGPFCRKTTTQRLRRLRSSAPSIGTHDSRPIRELSARRFV
jgi:hypothetical protein